jgi:hypothetical protein
MVPSSDSQSSACLTHKVRAARDVPEETVRRSSRRQPSPPTEFVVVGNEIRIRSRA